MLLIRNFRKAEFYIAPEELPRGTGARTVYGNVGMITFIVLTVLLTAISLPIAAVARIMKAGIRFPVGLSVACIACVACVALRTPLPLFAAADRAVLKIIGMRDRLRHRIRHRGQQQVRSANASIVPSMPYGVKPLSFTTGLWVGKPHGRMFHGADDVGLHTLHIHARLRGERHRHQALVRRVKLLQRGGVQNGIGMTISLPLRSRTMV